MRAHSVGSSFIQFTLNAFGHNNNKLALAARKGFFYIEMPEKGKQLINKGIEFANTFYKDDKLKKLELDVASRYDDKGGLQVESLHLESRFWKTYLNGKH